MKGKTVLSSSKLPSSAEIRGRLNHPVIDSDGHMIEFQPTFLDFLKEVGGSEMVKRYPQHRRTGDWYAQSPKERAEKRTYRPAWWGVPTKNTLDRVTSTLPKLLYQRMDEFGLDFTVLYPSAGLVFAHAVDEELRRATCRALNQYSASVFSEYADRMAPVAAIPMHTPAEAIEELEYAVGELRMKAILMPSYVHRPRADGRGNWLDTYCLDSDFDYDPVWAKCLELKVAPTFHSGGQAWDARSSISNYMYNHIGHFAASGEALCKSVFLGGVTRRFPKLRMPRN